MSYKPDKEKLIAYLYGELSAEEHKLMEAYIEANSDAKAELAELEDAQSIIGKLKDHEVEVPTFTFDNASQIVVSSGNRSWWQIPLGIAASIALLMVAGYLTSFRLISGTDGLQLGFGSYDQPSGETFTKGEVKELIDQALVSNNQLLTDQLDQSKFELMQSVANLEPTSLDQKLLNNYIQKLREYNAEAMSSLVENAELDQRKYTDQIIQDLVIFLDLQRQNDLELIQSRIENLSEDARRYNRQTDQILTSLISSDQGQNNNQY